MKDKGLVIGVAVVAVAVAIGIFVMAKPKAVKTAAAPVVAAGKTGKAVKAAPAVPVKKAISKDMGALTVKIAGANGKEMSARIKAFRGVDSRSSVFAGTFMANRSSELIPGSYDIEIETTPAKIYKGVNVTKGRDTVEDLGRVTGSLEIKATGLAKKPVSYAVKVLYPKSGVAVTTGAANRPIEIAAGTYDVEIGSLPKQVKKEVKVDAGKELVIDIGPMGAIVVKTVDDTGKEVKSAVRIKRSDSGELVASPAANKPTELMAGTYTVESVSAAPVKKGDIKVAAGEETVVELVVPAAPAKK